MMSSIFRFINLNHALCLEIAEGTFGNKQISYEDLCIKYQEK